MLGVMVRVDLGEPGMVHVSVLGAAGYVEKIKFHGLAVRVHLAGHARPIARITIMGQHQAISVEIDHVIGSSGLPAAVISCMNMFPMEVSAA